MGAVYRARDLHFPNVVKLVAVKEMINQASDPLVRSTIVRNFEREANLLATLDHPAIPRIYDYFTFNERSYLILEYVNGKDLEAILDDTDDFIEIEKIINWGIELCDVLSYLHNHTPETIIFRDMKPSNVMINHRGHVVLVDFGIAKPFQSGQKGTMIGTEGYSPPEQYRGEATHLADIYALGATLHHLLTRRDPRLEPPFSFGERSIKHLNPKVPDELVQAINTALQYDAQDRYQTAETMKSALSDVAHHTGVLPPSPRMKTRAVSSSGEVSPVWDFACEDEIRGTPTLQNGAVYIGSYDHNVYGLDARNGEMVWKFATKAGVVSKPAVYQGNVFFGSEDSRVYSVTAKFGSQNWSHETGGPVRSSPHIAEGHIFIGSDDHHIHAINTVTGRSAWQIDVGAPIRSTPIVDEETVLFGTESGDFYCLDFKGNTKWRFQAKRAITSSPTILEGAIYFGSLDATLYALDAKTGWVIWRFRMVKPTISSPFIHNGMLLTGSIDGNIYCIDAQSAKEVWRYTSNHQVTGSPIVYQDRVYCGSVDGNLYCLDYRTGKLQWTFQTEGPITGNPIADNDVVYIGSTDHHLYALPA
jgi:outer membrane protein assembly factor BamB/tRNA A-37 threonylcarbamoyl transferase component Bud32